MVFTIEHLGALNQLWILKTTLILKDFNEKGKDRSEEDVDIRVQDLLVEVMRYYSQHTGKEKPLDKVIEEVKEAQDIQKPIEEEPKRKFA